MNDHPHTPFDNGHPERDSRGRFQVGNVAGKRSKPHAASVQALRSELFRTISPERFRKVLDALLTKAESGDTRAAKVILNYTLGQPLPADIIERIESLEQQLEESAR